MPGSLMVWLSCILLVPAGLLPMFNCCSIYAILKLVWLSTQWAELKAILISLANTPFDEKFFFFLLILWILPTI